MSSFPPARTAHLRHPGGPGWARERAKEGGRGAVVGALLVVTTWRRQEQVAGLGPAQPEHRAG